MRPTDIAGFIAASLAITAAVLMTGTPAQLPEPDTDDELPARWPGSHPLLMPRGSEVLRTWREKHLTDRDAEFLRELRISASK